MRRMRIIKDFFIGIFVLLIIGSLVYYIFQSDKNRSNRELAKRIAELSPRGGPPETIEGLRQAIALYEAQIMQNVKDGAQTGTYWKILAIRLSDRSMHRDALDAFERALYFNTDDPVLYYLTGLSAGTVAKSIVDFSINSAAEREHFYRLSETAYLRALELDEMYTKPMYGIGVLYTFELNKPEQAIPYLKRYLDILRNDIPAMFVLARAYYMIGNFRNAIELYETIISRTKDQNVRTEAENNIDIIQRMMYG